MSKLTSNINQMKKTLLSLLILIGWSNHSNAQMYHGSGFLCLDCYSNIEVGANLSMFSGMNNPEPKVGFSITIGSYKEINERIYLKFGPSFSQYKVGFDKESVDDLVIYTIAGNVGVHYLKQRDYQFFGGVNVEANIDKGWMSHNDTHLYDIEFLTYSLYAGGGLIFAERIELSAKYNFGLKSIVDNPSNNWKRNYFSLTLGYTFL